MNMEVLRRSRKPPIAGDIFVLRIAGQYMHGRVVRTDAKIGGFPNVAMIYIFKFRSLEPEPIPSCSPSDLLFAPKGTNALPWSKGYFRTIENRLLGPTDVLQQHCFYDDPRDEYVDEYGRPLKSRIEPCGFFGLDSFRTIDAAISRAIGIPESREDSGSLSSNSDDPTIVTVAVKLSDTNFGEADERFDNHDLEDQLEVFLGTEGLGEIEGHEVGQGYFKILIRSDSAQRLQKRLVTQMRAWCIAPGSIVERISRRKPIQMKV